MKLFLWINSISHCHLLQLDLNNLVSWREPAGLSLNIFKYSIFLYSPLYSLISFPYFILNVLIKSSGDSIRDVGFTLARNFSPVKYIEEIYWKTFNVLGFMLLSSIFYPRKALYCAPIYRVLDVAVFHGTISPLVPVLRSKEFRENSSILQLICLH